MTTMLDPKLSFLANASAYKSERYLPIRESAMKYFRELPLPSSRTEDWRFTSVANLVKVPFQRASAGLSVKETDLPAMAVADAIRLVFVNGRFDGTLSRIGPLPTGVAIGSLANADTNLVRDHLAEIASFDDHVFTALNTSVLEDGAYVIVSPGNIFEKTIEILHVTVSTPTPLAAYPRTLIVLGQGSQARVIERFLALGEDVYFNDAVCEIRLAADALLDHAKIQQENLRAYHVSNTQAILAGKSTFTTNYVGLGGSWVRNEVRVRFDGEFAEATVNGVYLGGGTQHLDNHTVIDHAQPNCASHELYKGILGGKAQGVFNGKIFVRKDAQKTDAKQTNKALLLSQDATINTKPQLEIFADDVKCTHGATVGQLDETQLFYLRSRGIPQHEAQGMLTFAFANDIVRRIQAELLREELESLIVNRQFSEGKH